MKLTEEHINKIEDKVRKNLKIQIASLRNKNWLLQDSILYHLSMFRYEPYP